MRFNSHKQHSAKVYLIRFAAAFCILYFGTLAMIGLAAPGGYYVPFIKNYLDYISVLRKSLLISAQFLAGVFGYESHIEGTYFLKDGNNSGVRMVYQCIGYGVMSIWGAFVIAINGTLKKKLLWIVVGWFLIFLINVFRITLLFISTVKKQHLPFNIDHHTLFNIIAYALIIILMYYYDKRLTKAY